MTDFETAESWEQARQIVSIIGTVPSSFSTSIRFLQEDAEQRDNKLSTGSRFAAGRLLKSPSLAAPFYYCAKTFRPQDLETSRLPSPGLFFTMFKPDELAAITAITYLYRKIRKGCDKAEWELSSKAITKQIDIGGHVGTAIPAIGFSTGLLAGAMRQLSVAMFLGIDKKGFVNYRRELKRRGISYDLNYEFKTWGCTHPQVASILSQPLALGSDMGKTFSRGLSDELGSPGNYTLKAPAMQAACIWINSLFTSCKQPEVVRGAQFYPMTKDLNSLLEKTESINNKGSAYEWINRGKADVSEQLTPEIFGQHGSSSGAEIPPPAPDIQDDAAEEDLEDLE